MPDKPRTLGEVARGVDRVEQGLSQVHVTLERIEVHLATEKERTNHLQKEVNELRSFAMQVALGVSTLVTAAAAFLKAKLGLNA